MPVSAIYLRRWFAAGAILVALMVAGVYFYARLRVQNALKQVPEKMGVEIQQSATGFTISKSEQGRTWFKIEASKAVQFKQGGKAHLHDVTVTIYGRDSSRYDRISGTDFDYDPQAGDITAQGEVQIDLEANPEGASAADQAAPLALKNPIHLKTSGLMFNQKTGDASTNERVDFSLPQAGGSAIGVRYLAASGELQLESQINILTGSPPQTLTAARAIIGKREHQIWLDHPRLISQGRRCESDQATFFLRPDNRVNRILATDRVVIQADDPGAEAQADQLELFVGDKQEGLRKAILSGSVTANVSGAQPAKASAGRILFDFGRNNQIAKIHAEENVRINQRQTSSDAAHSRQDLELTAAAVEFLLSGGNRLTHSETFGTAQISIRPVESNGGQQTLVTAGKFEAKFDNSGQISAIHGAPDAHIMNTSPGQPDRVSTSRMLDATFHPGRGIESLTQQGSVVYTDGDRQAWADTGRYTPTDQVLLLTGSPRISERGMTTTAQNMRLERATGTAFADGNVKTTYSNLASQPNGALLASSSPIHVAARSMTAHSSSATALYRGEVRLWQDANVVEAPMIDFDRDHRSLVARGESPRSGPSSDASQPVSTVLVQTDSRGSSASVAVTSSLLTYTDAERQVHFEGGVLARQTDLSITARQMDAFLEPRGTKAESKSSNGAKLDKIVASGQVVATEPKRRAEGDRLVYTSADDKFVLTGVSPSIFDAEQGKITGVSLTFFRHDDRVLVEGSSTSPAVAQTRVAR